MAKLLYFVAALSLLYGMRMTIAYSLVHGAARSITYSFWAIVIMPSVIFALARYAAKRKRDANPFDGV